MLALVAAGQIVCPLNAHVDWYYTYPGIAYLPIHDAPVTEWVLVWATGNQSAHLHALIQTARDLGPQPITNQRT